MRVLIAFECSDTVRAAFAARGHTAYSNDLKPTDNCDDSHHIQSDVYDAINCSDWDLIIAHPPCTALAVSGNGTYADSPARAEALSWTVAIWEHMVAVCLKVALENPVGVLADWRPASQYIQPHQFGEDASKKTGLWLHNLPPLRPTEYVPVRSHDLFDDPAHPDVYSNQTASGQNKLGPSPERAALRAKTYQGIANAMANQWG